MSGTHEAVDHGVHGKHEAIVDEMTWRAKAYLSICAARHGLLGISTLLVPNTFQGPAFEEIRGAASLTVWGMIFIAGGLHLTYAAWTGKETAARSAMTVSAIVTSVWAAGFIMAFEPGGVVSPVAAILFSALTLKDLVICRQPMRSPFEPLVRKYAPTMEKEHSLGLSR